MAIKPNHNKMFIFRDVQKHDSQPDKEIIVTV